MGTKETGIRCEQLVCDYLSSLGHEIVARNYHCQLGEIDIVSINKDTLCVTEVKSLTRNWTDDEISHMVDRAKQSRIRKTLSSFLSITEGLSFSEIRFDVASVKDGKVKYYEGAF